MLKKSRRSAAEQKNVQSYHGCSFLDYGGWYNDARNNFYNPTANIKMYIMKYFILVFL